MGGRGVPYRDGSRTDVDREALREAAHALRRVGRTCTAGHELFVA